VSIVVKWYGQVCVFHFEIPMETNCAPFQANLFLYSYEKCFMMQRLLQRKENKLAHDQSFNFKGSRWSNGSLICIDLCNKCLTPLMFVSSTAECVLDFLLRSVGGFIQILLLPSPIRSAAIATNLLSLPT
jgi:hypothetical protein